MRLGREGATPGEDRTPHVVPGSDPSQLSLTPAEGYLLSRIDGHTPLSLLRQIGGMPSGEIDRCIERLAKQGVLAFELPGREPPRGAAASAAAPGASAPAAAATGMPQLAIDPSLELPVEVQQRVVEFEARLLRPYHEILGVSADADVRAIKQAYFGLSKQFHPDRYFRRNLGPYAPRIERIFKKVLEAYELLSDPTTRAEVQATQAAGAAERAAAGTPDAAAARRLRARLSSLTRHRRVLDGRKQKAKSFFESGMAAFHAERWLEAAGSVRLAIAFDPENEAFKGAFSDVQRRAHEERARVLLKEADGASSLGDWRAALPLYEEALHYRSFDAALSEKTARLALRAGGDLRKAKEYALAACELEPDVAAYRRTLGHVYKAAGLQANARREFQNAVRLDPSDAESKQELKSL